jgi:quercetin dioxygenase-like cupin family protein
MAEPIKKQACVANIHTRMMHFVNAGDTILGHKHTFDHITLLAHGSLKIDIDGAETIYKAPALVMIRKDKRHELTALEDNTVAVCINGIRDGDGVADLIEPEMYPRIGNIPIGAKPITAR